MKKNKDIFMGIVALIVIVVIILLVSILKWSETSFEAVVKETITMQEGEVRLIVERTTEIYGHPFLLSNCL